MKHLLSAFICLFVGFGAYANDLKPKKDAPVVTKVAIQKADGKTEVETTQVENARRKQKSYGFRDGCGQIMIVYVSGGDNVSDVTLWNTAADYAEAHMNMFTGCFF